MMAATTRMPATDHTTYWSMSLWTAAFLLERGCVLLKTEIMPNGKARFCFERHPALELANEYFNDPDNATCNAPDYADSYHFLLRAADAARELMD